MAIYMWRELPDYLCFTANTAWSTVRLAQIWSPTAVTLETSTDGSTRTTYPIGNTITLSNIWDKVYWRNTSTTATWFSTSTSDYYQFVMTWSIAASWNTNYLLNKNSTNTVNSYWYIYLFNSCSSLTTPPSLPATTLTTGCYQQMFYWCTWLTTPPELPAATLENYCYFYMFYWCSSLTTLPELPATTLAYSCYYAMFAWCTNIKLSETQAWEYQTPYRIPTTWTWTTTDPDALVNMFLSTWWTFASTPSINTTYYTSNTVI